MTMTPQEQLKARLEALFLEAPDRIRDSVIRDQALSVEFRIPDPSYEGHFQVVCCLTVEGDFFRIGLALSPTDRHTFQAVVQAYGRAQRFIEQAGLRPAPLVPAGKVQK